MARTIIIGAGLTGLSTAYHLEQTGFFDYTLFEKETTIGGLCGSIEQDGFTFDFTGHLLHISDPYFRSFINKLVGFEHFNTINRRSYIYSHNVYTHYPYQMHLYGLPLEVIADCIEGFATKQKNNKQIPNFYEWVLENFGAGLAKHFFVPYQTKIFDFDVHQLSSSWTQRFVPQTSLRSIIKGSLQPHQQKDVGYNAQFFYPKKGGIVSWVNNIAQALKNPIQHNFCVKSVNIKMKNILFTNGHVEPFDHLISTMPLDTLLGSIEEPTSTSITSALPHLKCNSIVNYNLGVNRADLSDKHWIYFPETEYPFYRIGFPHNFSEHMTPKNCNSLYGEFSHLNRSQSWIDATLTTALKKTKKVLQLNDVDIITEKILYIKHAYVIYDFWRDQNIDKLHTRLHEHAIYSIGRYGQWKYASMQEAVLDGKSMAKKIIEKPSLSFIKGKKNRGATI